MIALALLLIFQPPIERRQALTPGAGVKIFVPAGHVRLIGWDKDTLVVHGTIARGSTFYYGAYRAGVKISVDPDSGSATLEIHVPRSSLVSIKAVSADIDASDVSGWFYGVSSHVRLDGTVRNLEAESISGDVNIGVTAPWVRGRTGQGRLTIGGQVADVTASTINGAIALTATGLERARVSTVNGNIRFAGDPGTQGLVDIDDYGGPVDLTLATGMGGQCEITTVSGAIVSAIPSVRPVRGESGRGQSLALAIGHGTAHVTVRTFKGDVHVTVPSG
jgi:Putative adhesin